MTVRTEYAGLERPRVAGIMNLVGAALSIITVVTLFVCLHSGVFGRDVGNDVESGIGFAASALVCLSVLALTFIPVCAIDSVWQIFFGIKLLRTGRSLSRGLYVASLILKILSVPVIAFDSILIYGFAEAGGSKLLGGDFCRGVFVARRLSACRLCCRAQGTQKAHGGLRET